MNIRLYNFFSNLVKLFKAQAGSVHLPVPGSLDKKVRRRFHLLLTIRWHLLFCLTKSALQVPLLYNNCDDILRRDVFWNKEYFLKANHSKNTCLTSIEKVSEKKTRVRFPPPSSHKVNKHLRERV
jgi:hypothetical protein